MLARSQYFYKSLIGMINEISYSSQSAIAFVRSINYFIIENQISDKAISYHEKTPYFASWNIGCGSRWVNPNSPIGSIAAGVPNPTFDIERKVTKEGHNERMECCAEILRELQRWGIKTIALQEAPLNLEDDFYKSNIITTGAQKSNIRLAVCGEVANWKSKLNDAFSKEVIGLRLKYAIAEHEIQIVTGKNNQLIANLHFDWYLLGAYHRKNRVIVMSELMKAAAQANFDLHMMGDTNLDYSDIVTRLPNAALFGANGCNTVDIIMHADIQFCYLPSYRHFGFTENKLTSGLFTGFATENFSRNFELNPNELKIRKGKGGMVQFHFQNEKQAIKFAEVAFKLYEAFESESSIVIRSDQPLVIRLSEKQYSAMLRQLKGLAFLPYEALPTSVENLAAITDQFQL